MTTLSDLVIVENYYSGSNKSESDHDTNHYEDVVFKQKKSFRSKIGDGLRSVVDTLIGIYN